MNSYINILLDLRTCSAEVCLNIKFKICKRIFLKAVQLIRVQIFVTYLEIFTSVCRHLLFSSVCQKNIQCSLTNNRRKTMTITIQCYPSVLSLPEHWFLLADFRNFIVLGREVGSIKLNKILLIWSSFGHLGRRFIAGIVKRFVQSHVLAQPPPGRRPAEKSPANTSHRSRFV
jgi:hypothetical protein